jgi:hypothetical protein
MPTEIIHSIKPLGGGDYTDLQTWESTEQRSLTAVDEIEIAEVYAGGNASNNTVLNILGWTTDKERHIHIRAAHNQGHSGLAAPINRSRAYIQTNNSADAIVMSIQVRNVRLSDLQIIRLDGASNVPVLELLGSIAGSNMQVIANRCIVIQDGTNPGSTGAISCVGGGESTVAGFRQEHTFNNCFIMSRNKNSGTGVVTMTSAGGGNDGRLRFQHCTIIARNNNIALVANASTTLITRNCYMRSPTAIYSGAGTFRKGGGDATNNNEAIHPPYQFVGFNNDNFVNVASGAEDVHLVKSSSGVLINGGDNVVNRPFNQNIFERTVFLDWEGDYRSDGSGVLPFSGSGTFDIGADEIVDVAGPTTIGGLIRGDPGVAVSGILGGYIQGDPHAGPTDTIGGHLFAKVIPGNELFDIAGGFVKSTTGSTIAPKIIGGFVLSLPLTEVGPEIIGAYNEGRFQNSANLGGFTFGRPDYNEFVATRARTLTAVTSENVVDQALNIDAKIIFKQLFQNEFNAKLDNVKTFENEINAKVEVEKFKVRPSVFILSIDLLPGSGEVIPSGQPVPNFDSNGTRQVCVTASGTLGDGDEFVHAYIDFGAPFSKFGGFTLNQSISGFTTGPPWTACHDYNISGLYSVVVRAQDNQGMVGMDASGLNLASGAIPGFHFPKISISGVPRFGLVPPSLRVDFTTTSSGIPFPPYTARQGRLSTIQSPTDNRILWNLGNRETSRRRDPVTYYNSPGLYAPTLRYLYVNPSGAHRKLGGGGFFNDFPGFGVNGQFMISDTLLVGFNR